MVSEMLATTLEAQVFTIDLAQNPVKDPVSQDQNCVKVPHIFQNRADLYKNILMPPLHSHKHFLNRLKDSIGTVLIALFRQKN